MITESLETNVFYLFQSLTIEKKNSNDFLINIIGINFTFYAIIYSKELKDKYFDHKLDLNLSFSFFL